MNLESNKNTIQITRRGGYSNLRINPKIETFGDLALSFSDEQRTSLKQSSYYLQNYNIQKFIIPNFGDVDLSDISEELISDRIINLKADGETPTVKTKSIIFRSVKQILLYGMHQGYVKPMLLDFKIPDITVNFKAKDKSILTDEEIEKIIKIAKQKQNNDNIGVLLSLFLGLKIGEICALKWEDFNFENNTVTISRSISRVLTQDSSQKSKIVEASLSNTKRTVKLSQLAAKILEAVPNKVPNYYVLTGTPDSMEPRTFRRHFSNYLTTNGFREMKFQILHDSFVREQKRVAFDSGNLFIDLKTEMLNG